MLPLQLVICASLLSGLWWLLQRGSQVALETPAGKSATSLTHHSQSLALLVGRMEYQITGHKSNLLLFQMNVLALLEGDKHAYNSKPHSYSGLYSLNDNDQLIQSTEYNMHHTERNKGRLKSMPSSLIQLVCAWNCEYNHRWRLEPFLLLQSELASKLVVQMLQYR